MAARPNQRNDAAGGDNQNAAATLPEKAAGQLTFDLGHTPSHAEDDFIVNPGNALAFEHILAFPNWPGPLTLVTGSAKSGKSHLARIWVERSGATVVAPDDVETLAGEGGTRPVLIEDADSAGYEEAALFHLLNQSMRDSRPVLMTARTPVDQWPYAKDDLLSRARLAAHFSVESPDDIQLSHMLVKLFADRQIAIDPKVVSYLVARMERSTEEAVRLVEVMDKLALTRRGPVSRTVAAEALATRADAGNRSNGKNGHERDQ